MILLNETLDGLKAMPRHVWVALAMTFALLFGPAVLLFRIGWKRTKEEAEQQQRYEEWCKQPHYCPSLGENVTKGFCDNCTMTEHCSTSVNNI